MEPPTEEHKNTANAETTVPDSSAPAAVLCNPNKKQKTLHVTSVAATQEAAAADGATCDNSISKTLLLPVTCLAAVLDFLPYPDVRNALLAGKAVSVEAASHIDCLNITHPAGLNVPAARFRFPNVTEVNVTCFFYRKDGHRKLSERAATRTVPFLSSFSKLKVVDMRKPDRTAYDKYYGDFESNAPLYRVMVNAFCCAFSAKALPDNLLMCGVLEGVFNPMSCMPEAEEVDTSSPCQLCRSICKWFPFKTVLRLSTTAESWREEMGYGNMCISEATKLKILQSRPGGPEFLGTEKAINHLFDELEYIILQTYPVRDDSFKERMIRLGANVNSDDCVEVGFNSTDTSFDELVQALSIIAKKISSGYFMARIKRFYKVPDNCRLVIEKRTSDMLISAGYPLEQNAIIVVDCEQEPALAGLFSYAWRQNE